MMNKKYAVLSIALIVFACSCFAMGSKPGVDAKTSASKVVVTAGSGENWVRGEYYFTYQFDKNPSLGTNILKVQVFNKNGEKESSFKLIGNVSMPSMGHAHDSGGQTFQLNKKNDYLLPVDLVMRGEWEIILVFKKDDHDYARAKINVKI